MAYRNFNPRRERDRGWTERWTSPDQAEYRPQYRYDRGESDDFERRGWREGSDYYGNRAERYAEPRYRGSWRDDRSPEVWGGRDDERAERYRGRGIADAFGDFTWADDDWRTLRWSDQNEPSQYVDDDWRRDRSNWREDREDQRAARDTQRWRSDMLRYGGWGSLASAVGIGQGEFRGRGPRGYRRSDERILDEVCERLTDDPRVDASEIEVKVANGEVTLSGTVGSRGDKRRAEDLAESVAGVRDVHNRLRTTEPGLLERAADALRPHAS